MRALERLGAAGPRSAVRPPASASRNGLAGAEGEMAQPMPTRPQVAGGGEAPQSQPLRQRTGAHEPSAHLSTARTPKKYHHLHPGRRQQMPCMWHYLRIDQGQPPPHEQRVGSGTMLGRKDHEPI